MNVRQISSRSFPAVSALGALYLLAESVLQSFGKSICGTEGCKIVSQYTRFGDLAMVLLGLAVLAATTALAAGPARSQRPSRDLAIDVLLVTSLAGEGYFVGFQLFRLHAVCVFCMSVLGIFVLLGALRVAAGRTGVIAGFGALLAVLGLFVLVLPAGGTALPTGSRYILFYSPDCGHCTEIRKDLEQSKTAVVELDVREYTALLKSLGIEHVPTLMVNGPAEKLFLTGTDAIRKYLACEPAKPSERQVNRKAARSAPALRTPAELFPSVAAPDQIFNPLPQEGLCKEDTKCD